MRYLYSFGIRCYAFGVKVAALFNPKAKKMVAGWRRTFARLSVAPVGKGRTAWFHASSLGEFEQARPVLEEFRRRHPEYKVCVTFFSPSGFEVRKNYPNADFVCYLPMDTRANAIHFVNLLRPSVVFFAKYDFWFNYLEQLRRRDIPTFIFSSIFRPQQYFFKWYGGWFLRHLRDCFTHIFVQNEESVKLLHGHGVMQVTTCGDTRFDRVRTIADEARRLPEIEEFVLRHEGWHVVVAGSSWEPDEELLAKYLHHREGRLLLVVAPHVIDESHLRWIEEVAFEGERCTRYSQLADADPESHILIIDNIGMLSSIYRYAEAAYIGGGFGAGIHNVMEAAAYGKPVVFGPNYHKFREACDLVRLQGGFGIKGYGGLEEVMDRLLDDRGHYEQASQVCRQYLNDNLGATEQIMTEVDRHIINI
ncbi:MAG: 3-deoxy-D-manno-octulosonic acid transferase [Bacteroidales bacterium]|nr:3-deoxy-D-manno-octulosonic acid transferase [Bacteroidales bacterium]